MKTTIKILPVLVLVLFIASAFSIPKNDDPVKTEKKARIKMIKNTDGHITEIDTVLTDFAPDNIEKLSKIFMDCHSEKMGVDSLKKTIMLSMDMDDEINGQHIYKFISRDGIEEITDLDVSTLCKGDSVMKKIIVITDSDGKDVDKKVMIIKGDSGDKDDLHCFPPKALPEMIRHKIEGNVIRLDDPSIVSFKKKDLGGNKEKIEIIREKPVNKTEPASN